MEKYDHKIIENKWQQVWQDKNTFSAAELPKDDAAYILDMFPYPSAQGLHVGHPEGYTATDIYSRYLRMKGVEVLHPMGWDAFGLPAENYAIKTGRHPRVTTAENIDNIRRQIKSLGFSYDWAREISTADPVYYRWTQWLFLQLYKKGLAYRAEAPVNWCPSCQTVLANEQVVDGKCERCQSEVEQRQMNQWFFKITAFAKELLKDLDKLDWPEPLKEMQRNWIGQSQGAQVRFYLTGIPGQEDKKHFVDIFTTRLDTIFGATFMVISPELARRWIEVGWQASDQVKKYVSEALNGRELERLERAAREKTGVDAGIKAINPATNEEIPVWVADYVLGSYGTGAIMAVPAHDERDWGFAKKFNLEIRQVVSPLSAGPVRIYDSINDALKKPPQDLESAIEDYEKIKAGEKIYTQYGILINSNSFTGLESAEAVKKISKKIGAELKAQYKLHDWLISRQRYWGAPIPIIYCEQCGEVPVAEKNLPVVLPEDVDFRPTGESPLVRSASFQKVVCPKCGLPARRESDTMDTFVDSSWYFLRYCDPHNTQEIFDKKKVAAWCPVTFYVGGAEHAVMHLLYARFFSKVLRDLGYVSFNEPFLKLRNQGLILGEDGQKMSKSRGNVVNPDEIVDKFGADTFRLYEMFMGPLEEAKPWNATSIIGIRRFLEKVWSLSLSAKPTENLHLSNEARDELSYWVAKTTKKVTDDIVNFRFNTAIAALMEFTNYLQGATLPVAEQIKVISVLLRLLYPLAPHITSELWHRLGRQGQIWQQAWPEYDPKALRLNQVILAVQVNGKLRGQITVSTDIGKTEAIKIAQANIDVSRHLAGKTIKRTIYVAGKLINFVA